jgi:hypothetical protein
MDAQLSFASLDFASKKKRTKRDVFLAEMAAVVPWPMLEAIIEPYYPLMYPEDLVKAIKELNGGRQEMPSYASAGCRHDEFQTRNQPAKLEREHAPD